MPYLNRTDQNLGNFDNFLCGMALTNHMGFLSSNWQGTRIACPQRTVAYLFGIGEHVFYLVIKVATFVSFIFINLTLLAKFFLSIFMCRSAQAKRAKMRLLTGLLIMIETVPGIGVDAIGVICPPLAYKVHSVIKKTITCPALNRLGYPIKLTSFPGDYFTLIA